MYMYQYDVVKTVLVFVPSSATVSLTSSLRKLFLSAAPAAMSGTLVRTLAKASGVVIAGVFTASVVSAAINVNIQKHKIKNGKACKVCKGEGFYKCKLCKGESTIEWSPLYDPLVINPCLCPTCDGNKVQRCLNCLGNCYV